MTNREWLRSLNDEQLAKFLTVGLCVVVENDTSESFYINVQMICRQYNHAQLGLTDWLSQPQQYKAKE